MITACYAYRRMSKITVSIVCFDHLVGFSLLSGLYVQIKSTSSDPIPQTISDETIPRDKSACIIHASPPQEPYSTPYPV